ncbi:hypothetical protein [Ruegeria meonggei]|uniref:hypothetical protein n=1 Tax=Ruegeria meonggei TaxID=1446476 RepID=UPI00366FE351
MSTKKTSPDHLVLCVHGIGNQLPGDTVGDVLSGALEEHNRNGKPPAIADETIVNLFETHFAEYDGLSVMEERTYPGGKKQKVQTPIHVRPKGKDPRREGIQKKFPMHVKRIREQDTQTSEVKTVMAEVYWADISPEPKGAFATIFDLIKVLMSIGYLALDNAANTGAPGGYRFVTWFLWALIGGVVALNAALLMGVLVLLLEGSLVDFNEIQAEGFMGSWVQPRLAQAIAGVAVVALVLGFICNRRKVEDPLWKWFGYCTVVLMVLGLIGLFILPAAEAVVAATGMLTILFGRVIGHTRWELSLWRQFGVGTGTWGLLILFFVPFLPEATLASSVCSMDNSTFCNLITSDQFSGEANQLLFFIGCLMLLLSVLWGLSVLLCLFVYVAWARDRSDIQDSAPSQQRRIYAPICSALLLLWMIAASSFWVAIQNATDNLRAKTLDAEHLIDIEEGLPETITVASHSYGPDRVLPEAFVAIVEMITPTMAIGVAFLLILFVCGIYVLVQRALSRDVLFEATTAEPSVGRVLLNGLFQGVFAASTLAFATMLALRVFDVNLSWMSDGVIGKVFLPFVPAFLLGLALVVYQMRDLVAGGLGVFRDIVVYANNNALDLSFDAENDLLNFPARRQIEGRFERVCEFMMGRVKPKHVTIICHSQGTVVATRALRRLLADDLFEDCEVTLVTMGSPVTHLYRKYFPRAFQIEPGDFHNAGKPINWYNIGRTDDFVGTYIEKLDELNGLEQAPVSKSKRNLLVPAGGHPGYFTDPYVWQHFSTKIGFNLL